MENEMPKHISGQTKRLIVCKKNRHALINWSTKYSYTISMAYSYVLI